ncbi:sensor histidine kinase [Enterococcus faecium]|uniref:GHKL domain-containing protein n=1 Tax=Enterococcus faecium TaxID=1352 RepID=A0A7V7KSM3_ENTFC|nr:GHKL domain-containing protein [Enterococcus faecium]KAA0686417.1 GHKL domain-containing protein [Enterococcus faecium]MBK5028712.1 GHKL domain-containing protein [Enterococcus faecium]MBK5039414.1 GHKL domain-containing protein [Enterococcus faecium]MBK5044338.1 GHKL domain-containing protein [Enterococcus faecium]MBK5069325.1 GHKL domain-containing protein [Enterococcus faecium]
MESIMFVLIAYLNLFIWMSLLFKGASKWRFLLFYLGLMIANMFFVPYTFVFFAIAYAAMCWFLYLLVENIFLSILLQNFLLNVVGISFFLAIDIPRYLGFYNSYLNFLVELVLAASLFLLIRKADQKYDIFDYFSGYTKKLKGLTILSVVIYVLIYIFHLGISFYSLDYILTSIITLLYSIFYTAFFIVFIIYKKKFQVIELYLKDNQETKEYYEKLDDFRHDYLNYISALEYSLVNDSQENSIKLLTHLKDYSLEAIDDARHNPLKRISDPAVRGLFYHFMERANQSGISYDIQVLNIINNIKADYIDVLRLLSIALNNAIEHCDETRKEEPISITINQTKERFYFKIENPADMSSTSLAKLMKRGSSTKKNGGLGLYNFSKITDKYLNANYGIKYLKRTKMFVLELAIYEKSISKTV